jgi:hypothetical protein
MRHHASPVTFFGIRMVAEARFKARPEVTYVDLAKRLKKHGFAETEAPITNKLATFFLACLAAMELEGVVLEEI